MCFYSTCFNIKILLRQKNKPTRKLPLGRRNSSLKVTFHPEAGRGGTLYLYFISDQLSELTTITFGAALNFFTSCELLTTAAIWSSLLFITNCQLSELTPGAICAEVVYLTDIVL